MKDYIVFSVSVFIILGSVAHAAIIEKSDTQGFVHFGFQTENGQTRTEDIKYNSTMPSATDIESGKEPEKSVEYRGGYSFISADGYEYTVLYKANKNGFQPYVTARKVTKKE